MGSIILKMKRCSLTILILASGSVFAASPASSNYAIPWNVLDGGEGGSSSLNYAMVGSVAQGGVGQSSSPSYVMLAGFHSLPDNDVDAIKDFMDNCTLIANTDQRDTNGDGYGNICDPDFDNNNAVNTRDYLILRAAIGTNDPDKDLDGNGVVNTRDYLILRSYTGNPPGPSGLAP